MRDVAQQLLLGFEQALHPLRHVVEIRGQKRKVILTSFETGRHAYTEVPC